MTLKTNNVDFDMKKHYGELLRGELNYEFVGLIDIDSVKATLLPYSREDIEDIYNGLLDEEVIYHYRDIKNEDELSNMVTKNFLKDSTSMHDFEPIVAVKLLNTKTNEYNIYPYRLSNNFDEVSNFVRLIDEYQNFNNIKSNLIIFNEKPLKSIYIYCMKEDNKRYNNLFSSYQVLKLDEYVQFKSVFKIDDETQQIRIREQINTSHNQYISDALENIIDIMRLYPDMDRKKNDAKLFDIALEKPREVKNSSRIIRQMAEVGNPEYVFLDIPYDEQFLKEDSQISKPEYNLNSENIPVIIQNNTSDGSETKEFEILGYSEDVEAFTKTQAFHNLYNSELYVIAHVRKVFNGLVKLILNVSKVTFNSTRPNLDSCITDDFKKQMYSRNEDLIDFINNFIDKDELMNSRTTFNHGKFVFSNGIVDFDNIKNVDIMTIILKTESATNLETIIDSEIDVLRYLDIKATVNSKERLNNDTFRNLLENI